MAIISDTFTYYKNAVSVFSNFPNMGVWIVEDSGKTLYVNKKIANWTKTSQTKLYESTIFQHICNEDWKNTKTAIRDALKDKYVQHEISIMTPEKKEVCTLASFFPLRDSGKKILSVVVVFTDITKLKIKASYASDLAAIVESSEDAIYSLDANGIILSWNKASEQLFGISSKQALGANVAHLIIPENKKAEMVKKRKQVIKGQYLKRFETVRLRMTNKGQEEFQAQLTISPLHDMEGEKINGVSVIARDITKRVLVEKERENLLARLDGLIQTAPVGIAFLDNDYRFVKVNNLISLIDGVPLEEHVGKRPNEVFNTDMAGILKKKVEKCQRNKKQVSFHYQGFTWENIQEKKYFHLICYPIRFSDNEYGTGIIIQDITEQKTLESKKDDFISMASHELKTPLTSIKAFSQIMQSMLPDNMNKEKKYLDRIESQTDRLTKIVNDLLDITKVRTQRLILNKEYFDFDFLVEEVAEMIQTTNPSHQIRVNGQTKKYIFADRERISQVISNLINNAVKYSPDSDKVDINLVLDKKQVGLEVVDYGIGIKKENIDKIFQNYYRIFEQNERIFPGLGIGLYVAKQIVKMHGGEISVESKPGKGSKFGFYIPTRS